MRWPFAIAGIVVACGACGGSTATVDGADGSSGDGSASSDGGTTISDGPIGDTGSSSWSDICDKGAARNATCDAGAFDRAMCLLNGFCADNALRPELRGPFADCIASRPCGESMDKCTAMIAQPYIGDPAYVAFRDQCLSKRAGCIEAGTGFNDDTCGQAVLVRSSVLQSLSSCLSKACSDVQQCFKDELAAVDCK